MNSVKPAVAPSPLTFGTMRLHGLGDAARAAELIRRALDGGVASFHVSSEYESWPFFVEAWGLVRKDREVSHAKFTAKVAGPHFGEAAFDPSDFARRIDVYRRALGLDRLDIVQWLLRHDLKDEAGRLEIFRRDAGLIAATTTDLKASGALCGLVSFPYTRQVADLALAATWCDGLALYVNRFETELAPVLPLAAAKPLGVIAIRPFAAGRVFESEHQGAAEALHYALRQPGVRTVVASVSSPAHLDEALAAIRDAQPHV